jgi:hypothetical protein
MMKIYPQSEIYFRVRGISPSCLVGEPANLANLLVLDTNRPRIEP